MRPGAVARMPAARGLLSSAAAMSAEPPTYDLIAILDPQAEEQARADALSAARAAIESGGQLIRHDEWGLRALAYPMQRRKEGIYHLLQFHTGGNELLAELDRILRFADGVLRFMVTKLEPGTPEPPQRPESSHARGEGAETAGEPAAA